ncbi:MAG: phospho-N-acetylmuramoyl-pentapeptide-transferase [Clostridia bacterium]|nr:phospho-N-acetylmuramoyl-pentapeptide-transferase [Clostridia bacterium]
MTQELISLLASGISFGVTAALGKKVIPWLHKLKYGQTIKEIGPKWHEKKQGTPTMGGIMFIAGILLSLLICLPLYYYLNSRGSFESSYEDVTSYWVRIIAGILMAAMFGAVGFLDDYIKVVKKQNDGLTPGQKMIFMTLIAGAFLATLAISGDATVTTIPFCANDVDVGFWFYPISLIMIVGFVNAVNLTDGIDGLCSSVTFFAAIVFIVIAGMHNMFGMSIFAAAVAGGCLGFLVWNFFPAKVFMGDTGSLFLGGLFCAMAYGVNMPILIPLVGIIYLCEAGSVMLQVGYFKLTHGKRIFKMSPIHHHFEMSGWSEVKIVWVFSVITLIAGVAAVALSIA